MSILKSIPMLAAMLLAFAVGAAPAEPTLAPAKKAAVKACPKTAKACIKAAKACDKDCFVLPAGVKKMSDSDDLSAGIRTRTANVISFMNGKNRLLSTLSALLKRRLLLPDVKWRSFTPKDAVRVKSNLKPLSKS